jgi:hypothetical protein
MKKFLRPLSAVAIVLALFVPTIADTIRLKDGNVIRGQVIGFRDQQFTVLVGSGAQGRRSRTIVYVEDVESIEFDSATTAAVASLANDNTQSSSNPAPTYQPPRSNPPPADTSRIPPRTNQNPQSAPSTSPTFFTIKVGVNAKQCSVPAVRGELCAPNGWTNTGLVVRQGQRLRISATGRVSLGGGRFSTPSGMTGSVDNEKLLRNEATGALIAVIGDDNDDFLLIGTRRDFVAQRDGVLFLGVNEGNLSDNTGTYDAVIEAEAGGPRP